MLLLILGCIPSRWANCHARAVGLGTVLATASAFGAALVVAAALIVARWYGQPTMYWLDIASGWGIYLDPLSATMMLLIAFVGLVIARFSIRYLHGDSRQGRFLRWISFTLGAVLTLVLSANLVMFTVAWVLTSFGLHQLLTHFHERPGALMAARKKFLTSRLGDLLLIAAMFLTYFTIGATDFPTIFTTAEQLHAESESPGWPLSIAATLLVIGAMTKSAQFPMHSWLPDTMETPTPVSALMHAGIINAGGFLVIRLSPLISLSHLALDFLAIVGTLTAVFGSVVMLTQPTVKRALAYSTMAQMGFMMLQCGLGAFGAALLHIVAHSLYKAHAFLSSGSILDAAPVAGLREPNRVLRRYLQFPIAIAAAVAVATLSAQILNTSKGISAGGMALGLILVIALTSVMWNALRVARAPVIATGFLAMLAVAICYRCLVGGFELLLAGGGVPVTVSPSAVDIGVAVLVALGFGFLLLLELMIASGTSSPLFESLYIHAHNGFYLDIPMRKAVRKFWKKPVVS
jgi:NAD(P)H-quinone oxidoreductase subunit 5